MLLAFQFMLAFVTLFSSIVFTQVNLYLQHRDWGYEKQQIVVVPLSDPYQFTRLKDEIIRRSDVQSVAGSSSHVGAAYGKAVIEYFDQEYAVARFDVGFDYIETMGLRLREGRTFSRDYGTDVERSVIINGRFARKMGWEDALEKRFHYAGTEYEVVGVLEDFHYLNLDDPIEPAFLRVAPEADYQYLVVRSSPDTRSIMGDYLRETWQRLIPDSPYEGYYQDAVFEEFLRNMVGLMKMSLAIGLITLIITSMGLLGLVSLNIVKRMKEISIRKILGADIFHVIRVINRDLIMLLLVGTFIATPLCYWAFRSTLDYLFPYHQELNAVPFLAAICLIFFTTALTIATHVYKAATTNPVTALRLE